MDIFDIIFGDYSKKELKKIIPIKDKVLALDEEMSKKTDAELKNRTLEIKKIVTEDAKKLDTYLPEALAICREGAYRVLGKKAYPVQIIGAIILHQGRIAEMKTGEGKTLVACLAAFVNALTGHGVHVVTVNDYLARTQADEMGKVFKFLGLTIGCILQDMMQDEKKKSYNADITYGTNNEFGFDYLRDNMVLNASERMQREHNFAIVDEVDSILIDEARTPLIISGPGDECSEDYIKADQFAKTLKPLIKVEVDTKEDNDDTDCDYIIDEKLRNATLTKAGIKKAEKYFNIINLSDEENISLFHFINQAIKANGVMKRDVDYVVKDGEIMIVDEFTGRIMPGRRFNEGLHQALEAKEGVEIKKESKTIANITFQNYFRLYKKLSGMTGTAKTEEDEFRDIYKLDVIEVPTNKPVIRKDHHDVVYKTEDSKYRAVVKQIEECHKKGQPVLVGTVSVEKSEYLSGILKKKGIPHNVLNAKYHDIEAKIVAQAGQYGSVTIATNMAGRGTDILLGGNAEYLAVEKLRETGLDEYVINEATGFAETTDPEILEARKLYMSYKDDFSQKIKVKAEKVKESGGLYIIGTERHESRRIDNQLRGRSGRQGDVGESKFFLSLEDDLMRIFGGDKVANLFTELKIDEDTPIDSKMLSKAIEASQKKLEGRNFNTRKTVLNYDDVMNYQREIVYKERNEVLDGKDISEDIQKMIKSCIEVTVNRHLPDEDVHDDWDIDALRNEWLNLFLTEEDLNYSKADLEEMTKEDIVNEIYKKAKTKYAEREEMFTSAAMRDIERVLLLKMVDKYWMDHIDNMDYLKKGINLRSMAQQNPVVEYRMEGFKLFDLMIEAIKMDTVKLLYLVQIR